MEALQEDLVGPEHPEDQCLPWVQPGQLFPLVLEVLAILEFRVVPRLPSYPQALVVQPRPSGLVILVDP